MNDEKRVGSPVVDLRQSLLSQADRQSPEDRQTKASADKLDKTVSSMPKESRDLESTGDRPHPGELRSEVEVKQNPDQAAGKPIASRIERDKSQVGFTCVTYYTDTVPYSTGGRLLQSCRKVLYLMHQPLKSHKNKACS